MAYCLMCFFELIFTSLDSEDSIILSKNENYSSIKESYSFKFLIFFNVSLILFLFKASMNYKLLALKI